MAETYLSFDCATKTFAFTVSRVSLPALRATAQMRGRAAAARLLLERAAARLRGGDAESHRQAAAEYRMAADAIARLDAETRAAVEVLDGEVADLAPGQPDASVGTVDRLRAVAHYIERRVRPALARAGGGRAGFAPLVVIEYQMGPNSRARAVAAALVALFAAERIVIVGPSLKNRVAASAAGQYGHFLQKHRTSYAANKAHARFNFRTVEAAFPSGVPPTSAALRGHIADSFMQVLGFILHGPDEKEATHMF